MSESPQKAKPRPRPRPRNAASSTDIDKPGSSSKTPLQDEDAMFIRNKNRSASGWSKMNEVVAKREAARSHSVDFDSSDSDSPRAKKTRRPFTAKPKEMPAWAKSDGLIQIMGSDSDGDSDASILVSQTHERTSSPVLTPKIKQKRQRSRSRSDSPDPQIQIAEQQGRERARQILGSQSQREKSPTYLSDDDGLDEVNELPAELAAIKAEVKRDQARASSVDNYTSSQASIELRITLRPHPEDESGKSYIFSHTMKRNEKFEQLFAEIADVGEFSSERLVVLFNNQRVYPWSTPQTLSIWSEAELVAYEEHVYKYIKTHERRPSPVDDQNAAQKSTNSLKNAPEDFAEPEASQDKSDTFKLQVRSGEITITVSVRPTTKCSAIVENVLRKMGRPAAVARASRIVADGEKLSPGSEIGDAELEDGDLIDIVGA